MRVEAQVILAVAFAVAVVAVVGVCVAWLWRVGLHRLVFRLGPFRGEVEARERVEAKVDALTGQMASVSAAVNNTPEGEGSLSEQVSVIKRSLAWQMEAIDWLLHVTRQLGNRVGGGKLPPGPGPRP